MTTYNTYQEAKIAMPLACIIEDTDSGLFFGMPTREGTTLAGGSRFAEPQYYCMTVEKFLADGHKFVEGDLILDEGVTWTVSDKVNSDTYIYTVKSSNKPDIDDNERYILRAAALENQMNIDNLTTQTPEEKETEWINGDECAHGHYNYAGASKMTYIGAHPFVVGKHICLSELKGLIVVDSIWLRKPESPQQREERERANGIYEMCASVDNFTEESNFWAGKFYDAGYRKESN